MSRRHVILQVASVFVLVSFASGCAKIWKTNYCEEDLKDMAVAEEVAAETAKSTVATKTTPDVSARASYSPQSEHDETTELPGVEIVWEVPRKPVEIFHLRYGFDRDHLDTALTLPIDKLEKVDDPAHGPVFKFRLPGVPEDRDVYVSMQAENHMGISEPSEVVRISAREKRVENAEEGGGS